MLVVKISRIIVIFCPSGTTLDAGAALDADPVHHCGIGWVNGTHGADPGAYAAAVAGVAGFRLDLQDVDGRSVAVPWRVIGADGGAAVHRDRAGGCTAERLDLAGNTDGKIRGFFVIGRIWTPGRQRAGKSVLPNFEDEYSRMIKGATVKKG